MTEEEKQERADNCTDEEFYQILYGAVEVMMKAYSVVVRMDPSARKRLNMDGRNVSALNLIDQYVRSTKTEVEAY